MLKIGMFPGLVRIDVAKAIDEAFADVAGCNRLIVIFEGIRAVVAPICDL